MPGLYAITLMVSAPREFGLGAAAFDAATVDFDKHRYAAAARKFLDAAIHFAASGAVGEANFGWSYKNAANAYEVAGQVKEGQAAFAAAAAADPTHAKVLQDRAAKIVDQRCP